MSSEKSARPGRYAHYYLASQPPISAETWLIDLIQPEPDWLVLDLSGKGESLGGHVRQVVDIANAGGMPDHLPFAAARFDLAVYPHQAATWAVNDLFDMMREAARVLKPGGCLAVQDVGLPEDERAARYVDVFYRFRAASQRRSQAAYVWQGMMLDAGLQVTRTDFLTTPTLLAQWAAECPPYVRERLHILLHQAPAPVADHLRPFAIGTPDAMFTQTCVTVLGHKPLA